MPKCDPVMPGHGYDRYFEVSCDLCLSEYSRLHAMFHWSDNGATKKFWRTLDLALLMVLVLCSNQSNLVSSLPLQNTFSCLFLFHKYQSASANFDDEMFISFSLSLAILYFNVAFFSLRLIKLYYWNSIQYIRLLMMYFSGQFWSPLPFNMGTYSLSDKLLLIKSGT